jgi:hypothetical protein
MRFAGLPIVRALEECHSDRAALRHIDEPEKLMSNETKSGNMNDQRGTGKNDPNRTMDAPKSGQQSQGTTPPADKGASQHGGSDHKSDQQSQGGSRTGNDGVKQAGSANVANDPKKTAEIAQKSGSPK